MTSLDPIQQEPAVAGIRYPLGKLLAGIVEPEAVPDALTAAEITGLALDSRQVRPGNAFVAIPGFTVDGRDYAAHALAAGAVTVLFESGSGSDVCESLVDQGHAVAVPNLRHQVGQIASRFYADPSAHIRMVGITGTNGKTTCAWLLSQALERLGEHCAMMGTIGSGFPTTLQESSLTTADAITIQRSLRHWRDRGATAVCMEVSSHGLDQGRIHGVQFDVAVFTNLSREHLDYHGDLGSYAHTKKKLFVLPNLAAVVTNSDDPLGREIHTLASAPIRITYGHTQADVRPRNECFRSTGIRFEWEWQQRWFQGASRLIGAVNLPNLLAVIATLLALGHEAIAIERVLPGLQPPPGRMELIPGTASDPAVVVDYAHTPDSLTRALQSLRSITHGRITVVFGCGGERDSGKRALMGQAVALHADKIVITNDNPRKEDPQAIIAQILQGVRAVGTEKTVHIEADRANAITTAIQAAGAGDLVLVAGKGHEMTQVLGDRVVPFSDQAVCVAGLEGRA